MPTAIGLRIYQLIVARVGDPEPLPIDNDEMRRPLRPFFSRFISDHREVRRNDEAERSFKFEPVEGDGRGRSAGIIQYGTFGFESEIVDTETQEIGYQRKRTDAEIVPLFYQLWTPDQGKSAFIAFSTFGIRSCATQVLGPMRHEFNESNPGFLFRYVNLIPHDVRGSVYSAAPVRRVRLIKRNASGDIAGRFLQTPAPVDFEIAVSAQRGMSLGPLGEISRQMRENVEGVIQYDGTEYDEARAEIKVGRKMRPVTIFGGRSNAGLIDVSDDIIRQPSGHPEFESIKEQASDIIQHFHSIVSGVPS